MSILYDIRIPRKGYSCNREVYSCHRWSYWLSSHSQRHSSYRCSGHSRLFSFFFPLSFIGSFELLSSNWAKTKFETISPNHLTGIFRLQGLLKGLWQMENTSIQLKHQTFFSFVINSIFQSVGNSNCLISHGPCKMDNKLEWPSHEGSL